MGLNISMNLARDNDISIFVHTDDDGTKVILGFEKIINMQPECSNISEGDYKNDCTGFTYSINSEMLYKELVKREIESEYCLKNFAE